MGVRYYCLNSDKSVSPCTLTEFIDRQCYLCANGTNQILYDVINGLDISTSWLGVNYNWFNDGPPLLFETMIFDGNKTVSVIRYATWQEAIDGHKDAIAWVEKYE